MPRRESEERKLKREKEQIAHKIKLDKWFKEREKNQKGKKRVLVKDPDSTRCWKETWVDE